MPARSTTCWRPSTTTTRSTCRPWRSGTADFRPVATTSLYAAGTTTAAAGADGQIKFTAAATGSSLAGVNVVFQDDAGVAAGNETVAYDSGTKTLTFHIDAGNTTAADV